jgi:hypothetical protein
MAIKASIHRISSLSHLLQNDEALQKHFNLDGCWDRLMEAGLSEGQVRRIFALKYNNKRFELNQEMVRLGFPRK